MKRVIWRRNVSVLAGRSHLATGTPCQDSVSTVYRRNVSAVSLSDGAGSCTHSHIGSQICANTLCSIMCRHFDELWLMDATEAKAKTLQTIAELLICEADERNLSLHDLSATALAVAVKKNRFIAFHIGDGVIGIELEDSMGNKQLETLSAPDNGEYPNETCFINSNTALQHLRLKRGSIRQPNGSSISGFILMSDGPESALYRKADACLAPACSKLLACARSYKKVDMRHELNATLELITRSKTQDDCSIALMAHVQPLHSDHTNMRKTV